MAAAMSFLIGKGISTQVVDRILGNVLTKGKRTGHQLFGLFRYASELAAGLTIYNLGNVEDLAKDAGAAVSGAVDSTLNRYSGGPVHPMKKKYMAKMYNRY